MRIAVAGTHCSGKTTLVEDFVRRHPEYIHEPEPYEWLVEVWGEAMGAEPTFDDFHRQLEVAVERLSGYARGSRMIVERSPIDFIAYLRALVDLRRGVSHVPLMDRACELAARGMTNLDLLVVLPLEDMGRVVPAQEEDLELRAVMDDSLLEIVNGELSAGLLHEGLSVIEIRGTRSDRLAALQLAAGV